MRKDEKRDSKYVWLGQMIAVGGEQDKHLQGLYLTSAVISRGQKHLWCNWTQVSFSGATLGIGLAMSE